MLLGGAGTWARTGAWAEPRADTNINNALLKLDVPGRLCHERWRAFLCGGSVQRQ